MLERDDDGASALDLTTTPSSTRPTHVPSMYTLRDTWVYSNCALQHGAALCAHTAVAHTRGGVFESANDADGGAARTHGF